MNSFYAPQVSSFLEQPPFPHPQAALCAVLFWSPDHFNHCFSPLLSSRLYLSFSAGTTLEDAVFRGDFIPLKAPLSHPGQRQAGDLGQIKGERELFQIHF